MSQASHNNSQDKTFMHSYLSFQVSISKSKAQVQKKIDACRATSIHVESCFQHQFTFNVLKMKVAQKFIFVQIFFGNSVGNQMDTRHLFFPPTYSFAQETKKRKGKCLSHVYCAKKKIMPVHLVSGIITWSTMIKLYEQSFQGSNVAQRENIRVRARVAQRNHVCTLYRPMSRPKRMTFGIWRRSATRRLQNWRTGICQRASRSVATRGMN